MDMQKYTDMFYDNQRGREWFSVLLRPDIWSRWVRDIGRLSEAPPKRILIEAIWHLGFARNNLEGCTERLHGTRVCERDSGVPMEILELDKFLEHVVRPLLWSADEAAFHDKKYTLKALDKI